MSDATVLQAEARRAQPGGLLAYRIRNEGTAPITFGDIYSLERRENGAWRRCRTGQPFRAIGHRLEAAEEATGAIWIAPDAPPGHYRMTKDVRVGEEPGHVAVETVSCEFDVQP